jgi:antitoxin (DNA-binding transcriptional repressor) of toxin-antitoxin stability system
VRTVNIHEAKTNFSRLVDAASQGEVIVIAKAGRPVAQLTRLNAPQSPPRLGFYAEMPPVPEDFDEWASDELADLFEGGVSRE